MDDIRCHALKLEIGVYIARSLKLEIGVYIARYRGGEDVIMRGRESPLKYNSSQNKRNFRQQGATGEGGI